MDVPSAHFTYTGCCFTFMEESMLTQQQIDNPNKYVIYHAVDADGWASATIVGHRLGFDRIQFLSHNNGWRCPLQRLNSRRKPIPEGSLVFVLDVSLSRTAMDWLNDKCDLVWIDHHASAIEELPSYPGKQVIATDQYQTAACYLTWEYMFPDKEAPAIIKILAGGDVRDNRLGPHFHWANEALRMFDPRPGFRSYNFLWKPLLEDDAMLDPENMGAFHEHMLERYPKYHPGTGYPSDYEISFETMMIDGRILHQHSKQEFEIYAKNHGYDTTFPLLDKDGVELSRYNVLACNRGNVPMDILDSRVDYEQHEFGVVYSHRRQGHTKVSLVSFQPDMDVSIIAKRFGGGGHVAAAGFVWPTDVPLPWRVPSKPFTIDDPLAFHNAISVYTQHHQTVVKNHIPWWKQRHN